MPRELSYADLKNCSQHLQIQGQALRNEFKMLHVNHPDLSVFGNTNHSLRTYETGTSEDVVSLWDGSKQRLTDHPGV